MNAKKSKFWKLPIWWKVLFSAAIAIIACPFVFWIIIMYIRSQPQYNLSYSLSIDCSKESLQKRNDEYKTKYGLEYSTPNDCIIYLTATNNTDETIDYIDWQGTSGPGWAESGYVVVKIFNDGGDVCDAYVEHEGYFRPRETAKMRIHCNDNNSNIKEHPAYVTVYGQKIFP
jgi:hypothetical protein